MIEIAGTFSGAEAQSGRENLVLALVARQGSPTANANANAGVVGLLEREGMPTRRAPQRPL
jgi:hypothetical protein